MTLITTKFLLYKSLWFQNVFFLQQYFKNYYLLTKIICYCFTFHQHNITYLFFLWHYIILCAWCLMGHNLKYMKSALILPRYLFLLFLHEFPHILGQSNQRCPQVVTLILSLYYWQSILDLGYRFNLYRHKLMILESGLIKCHCFFSILCNKFYNKWL